MNSAEAFLAERGSVERAQAEVSGPCLQVSPKGGNQNGDSGKYTPARTITVEEITHRLRVGEMMVYRMLENRQIPALRPGRNWIISRARYEQWEATFGGV